MAAASNEPNEATTIQDVLRILPKQEQTVQVKLQPLDSRNNRPQTTSSALYHTLRYDFKPASINGDEPASLELAKDGQVTIKAPNVGGSICTFKGQRRPHVKECLMVIDNRTGEVVLQKLTDNITVKATRTMAANGASNGAVPGAAPSGGSATASGTSTSGGSTVNSNFSSSNGSGLSAPANPIPQSLPAPGAPKPARGANDGPQLSEESSDDSDESSSCSSSSGSSSSSSSASSSGSASSSNNQKGFTF